MRHALWVWSAKNYEGKGPGFLDGVRRWFTPKERRAKELSVEDLCDIIRRTRPRYVAVKAFDGRAPMNAALLDAVVPVCKEVGAGLWLWAYQYPWNPSSKNKAPTITQCLGYAREQAVLLAEEAIRRGAVGVCSNTEKEWKRGWRGLSLAALETIAGELLQTTARTAPGRRVAVSSYAEPRSFPGMPWPAWAAHAHEQWPQLYAAGWRKNYLKRAIAILEQFRALGARRVVFSGPLYRGASHMRAMLEGVRPLFGTGRGGAVVTPPGVEVEDAIFWWSADQTTEDRERVILTDGG